MKRIQAIWQGIRVIPKRPRTIVALLLPILLAAVTYGYIHRGESLPAAPITAAAEATSVPEVFLPLSQGEENQPPVIGGFVVLPVETAIPPYPVGQPLAPVEEVPADLNGDGVVNIFDLVAIAGVYGSESEDSPADLNGDGTVNIFDIVIVANAFSGE